MSESTENPSGKEGEHKTPTKRNASKRVSVFEKAQRESEEIIKNMGGSLNVEGGRRTRSSARGTAAPITPSTPPPAKKARGSSTTPKRGRRAKAVEPAENVEDEKTDEIHTTPKKSESTDVTPSKEEKTQNCAENDTADGESAMEQTETSEDKKHETSEVEGKCNSEEIKKSITEDEDNEEEVINNSQPESSKEKADDKTIPEEPAKTEPSSLIKDPETSEPMEVDGTSSSVNDAPTGGAESDVEINSEKDSIKENAQELPQIDEVKEKSVDSEAHGNSIDKSSNSESKIDNIKTNNDVCEPKLSPTSPSDVIAAQPCN